VHRFLIIAELQGNLDRLHQLQRLVPERRPDGILFAGGILDGDRASHNEKLKKLEELFDGLGRLGVFTAVIPGPADVPLREFLRLAKDAEIEYPTIHVVHATVAEEKDLVICGLGGELTEAEDRAEDRLCYARASAEYFLRALWRAEQPRKVLLLSTAPPGPLGGETGNRICGDFIDSYHPSLCVVAGSTERRGTQRIAHTLVINPGRLADGSAAWLDLMRHVNEQVEFLDVSAVPVNPT
jgi:Icc-related predicted phosphoesterase